MTNMPLSGKILKAFIFIIRSEVRLFITTASIQCHTIYNMTGFKMIEKQEWKK